MLRFKQSLTSGERSLSVFCMGSTWLLTQPPAAGPGPTVPVTLRGGVTRGEALPVTQLVCRRGGSLAHLTDSELISCSVSLIGYMHPMTELPGWGSPGWLPEGGDIKAKLEGTSQAEEEGGRECSQQGEQGEGSCSRPLSGNKRGKGWGAGWRGQAGIVSSALLSTRWRLSAWCGGGGYGQKDPWRLSPLHSLSQGGVSQGSVTKRPPAGCVSLNQTTLTALRGLTGWQKRQSGQNTGTGGAVRT